MAYGKRKHTGNVNTTGLKTLDKIGLDQRCERIDDERSTEDGIWAYTVDGWCNGDEGSHIIHEDTAKEVLRAWQSVAPCSCEGCTSGKG